MSPPALHCTSCPPPIRDLIREWQTTSPYYPLPDGHGHTGLPEPLLSTLYSHHLPLPWCHVLSHYSALILRFVAISCALAARLVQLHCIVHHPPQLLILSHGCASIPAPYASTLNGGYRLHTQLGLLYYAYRIGMGGSLSTKGNWKNATKAIINYHMIEKRNSKLVYTFKNIYLAGFSSSCVMQYTALR